MSSSADTPLRRVVIALAVVAAIGGGLAAEHATSTATATSRSLPDLLVGWALVACGAVGAARTRASWTGPLLVVAGFAWFLPNFAGAASGALRTIIITAVFLHRGVLMHAIVTSPTGRTRSRRTLGVVALAYVAALIPSLWRNDAVAVALVLVLVGVSVGEYGAAVGARRRVGRLVLAAAVVFAVVIIGEVVARRAVGTSANGTLLAVYQLGVIATGIALTLPLVLPSLQRVDVTDLVVELGAGHSAGLQVRLAAALGDPSLQVGYWLPQHDRYVDSAGQPLSLPQPGSRGVTTLERDGVPLAVLVHDPVVLDDPGLLQAVASATKLGAANARLQSEVRARMAEASESRRRILDAADEERSRLERRVRDGILTRLDRLAAMLADATDGSEAELAPALAQAQDQLDRARAELVQLARGIHPGDIAGSGLAQSLHELAATLPVVVSVDVDEANAHVSDRIAACTWFVCAEALTNVVKYAAATQVRVAVAGTAGVLVVRIEDDGVGGAEAARGTGLNGLADRVAAVGGAFRVDSPPGAGTTVTAELPTAVGDA